MKLNGLDIELSERGVAEAEQLLEFLTKKSKKLIDEAFHDYYVNLPEYIESDSWLNYTQTLKSAFEGTAWEDNVLSQWGAGLRSKPFEEHRDELVPLLNADHLKKIEELEQRIKNIDRY